MVVIDCLHLLTSGKRAGACQHEVGEFSRTPKLMATELQVPVIALSHLNNGAEQRADKKPALSDLREPGAIEQVVDVVLLPHRQAGSWTSRLGYTGRVGDVSTRGFAASPRASPPPALVLSEESVPHRWAAAGGAVRPRTTVT